MIYLDYHILLDKTEGNFCLPNRRFRSSLESESFTHRKKSELSKDTEFYKIETSDVVMLLSLVNYSI